MELHVIPPPGHRGSDPALYVAAGYAWRAAAMLFLLFAGLRLGGVTSWQWWIVILPAIATAGGFTLAVIFMIGWALARSRTGGS